MPLANFQVERLPARPVMIYDRDCHFCRMWIERWRQMASDEMEFVAYQDPEVRERFPEIPGRSLEKSVHLVEVDGWVYYGAEAVFRSLSEKWPYKLFWWAYHRLPGWSAVSEAAYAGVAKHRSLFSRITKWLWGEQVAKSGFYCSRWLFTRGLGLIYMLAYLSLWWQWPGLFGEQGILPVDQTMGRVEQQMAREGEEWGRYWRVPTLFWLGQSRAYSDVVLWMGTGGALCAMAGVLPVLGLAVAWVGYLSIVTVGGVFLGYQWDGLLLEAGFLGMFLAAGRWWPGKGWGAAPSRVGRWLAWWLLFRLMFESGAVKWLSGDVLWRRMEALKWHYETQPLPTTLGWYAHQWPGWLHEVTAVAVFAVELILPFLIFGPRRLRHAVGWVFIIFQGLIFLTGNYGFFNLLTMVLCVTLFDDGAMRSWVPRGARKRLPAPPERLWRQGWPGWVAAPFAALIVLVSLHQLAGMLNLPGGRIGAMKALQQWVAPFRSVNRYGLFAVMTKERPEIVLEGSTDGTTWKAYRFKYKPGDPGRAPVWVAPHQPRLDWQMWFAALTPYQRQPWFFSFCTRLLEGAPGVLDLLGENPFPNSPPRLLRARLFDYRFSDPATLEEEGEWWRRERAGLYCPVLSLGAAQTGEVSE